MNKGHPRPMTDNLKKSALEYHRLEPAGKYTITPSKPMTTQRDLSLAYSPGVAAPCEEIAADPLTAYEYTNKGNVVAVISNGTAVLGLGNIGALASKPVMEGKSVLFKKFADIDSVDVEINETDPDKLIEIIKSLEPTYGGINLEDIKAPECFYIEEELKKQMNIPVFHDDQHGTAIIVSAAFYNWIKLTGRDLKTIKLVCTGAGASALSCLDLLVDLGLPRDNIFVCDREGVVRKERNDVADMHPKKAKYAQDTKYETVSDAIQDADVFIGLSGPGVITQDDVKKMAKEPLLMTLANPTPEILPEDVMAVRPDATIATGRSDYPNQVNNVLCFPFLFRGALDVHATTINEDMKIACVKAIAEITMQESTAEVAAVYGDEKLSFGKEYLIPKPFDPRLMVELPVAVAKAAIKSGVARKEITDWNAYREKLGRNVFRSSMLMRPVLNRAKEDVKRICFSDGEDTKVLRAAQVIVDEKLAFPILIGRRNVVLNRIEQLGLRLEIDTDFELCDPENDPRYNEYWSTYWDIMQRKGVTKSIAKTTIRTDTTVIGAIMMHRNETDGLICGLSGSYPIHRAIVKDIIRRKDKDVKLSTLSGIITNKGTLFMSDGYANPNPSAEDICNATFMAAEEVRKFGVTPRVALLSRSNFGSRGGEQTRKMQKAMKLILDRKPDFEVDGEMHADTALSAEIRNEIIPNSRLKDDANILIMPDADSANISLNLIKMMCDGITVGPILLGATRPVSILTPSATTRGIINMAALVAVNAQIHDNESAPVNNKKQQTMRVAT